METKKIIEINGVKLEVDLSTAKRIDEFRVGDPVKVLKKKYDEDKVYPGIIIGFENFKSKPTITVACLELSYNEARVEYIYYNEDSKVEIVHSGLHEVPFNKGTVIDLMDRQVLQKEQELRDLQNKKEFFLKNFNRYFGEFGSKEW